jgi:hypothetical protein
MLSQTLIACFLILSALVLLAVLNHVGWLLWLVPLSLLLARGLSGNARTRNSLAGNVRRA